MSVIFGVNKGFDEYLIFQYYIYFKMISRILGGSISDFEWYYFFISGSK